MDTFLNRNFKVRGDISCLYIPNGVTENLNIANIEVQLWHKAPMEIIFLGKSITNSSGEYTIEFEVDSPVSYVIDGKISDVFIRAFFNGEELIVNSLLQGLVAYWKMDGNSNDSFNSHNGSDTSITYSDANGIINNGAGCDGSISKILVPDSDDWNMGSGEFSISMWVKRADLGRVAFFGQIDSSGLDATASFALEFDASNFLIAWFGTGTLIPLSSIDTVTDTNWHHIVFTRRVDTIYLYLDAIQQSSYDVTGQTMHEASSNLGIGAWGDFASIFFSGSIDEVAVWKGNGLTEEEIFLLYNEGKGLQFPF